MGWLLLEVFVMIMRQQLIDVRSWLHNSISAPCCYWIFPHNLRLVLVCMYVYVCVNSITLFYKANHDIFRVQTSPLGFSLINDYFIIRI